ncbi:MAG TPA: glycine cleavage system aminomethyltransferase GcvT [Gemmataceae bacterium]|nr:glycine cleavage system aminomethyltransferase GcvT [Gemmataceae bacterium]
MTNRTPLYDWHVAHGARMVDFAGWDMPVQYTGVVDEHQAVRTAAGLFDISHMGRLSFGGPDSLALIQFVYTNNAATMKDGQVRYGLVCNEQGGIRDDVLVYRWPYGYAMVVNASNREKIVAWLAQHKGGRNVEITDQTFDTCMIAVQGPKAVALCAGLTDADPSKLGYYFATPTRYRDKGCVLSRTGYTGEDGLEIMVSKAQGVQLWEDLLARGAKPCGLGARDTLRLEAGMPLYGHELSEEIDPFQAGLDWAVKMDKGEFIGREALLRRRQDTSLRRRVGLELQGKRIAREGATVTAAGKEIGRVTSGTRTPTLNKALAMAYVEPAYTAVGTAVEVDVRGNSEPARVVRLPFYKRAKG